MLNDLEKKLYILGKLKGVGNKTLLDISAHPFFKDIPLPECGELNKRISNALSSGGAIQKATEVAEDELITSETHGISITSIFSKNYPYLLNSTPDRPSFLHTLGNIESITDRAISIIGTREPSGYSSQVTEKITEYFSHNNWITVSGLARGCDSIVHRKTISSKGTTVAIMAHGLQTIEPPKNRDLAKNILESGGVIMSEYPIGTRPCPAYFIARDRIQAGLSRGVIMIQSSVNGGSMFASRAALKYGRRLFIPCPDREEAELSKEAYEANIIACEGKRQQLMSIFKTNESMLSLIQSFSPKDDFSEIEKSLTLT